MITERPILFSGEMVRAILEGRKTQTRRLVKPQPHDDCGGIDVGHYHPTVIDRHGDEQPGAEIYGAWSRDGEWGAKCPFGQPGDRLWVRETINVLDGVEAVYAADNAQVAGGERLRAARGVVPSIFMPRWASRLTLEVTGVRVERVQDISDHDAWDEGCLADTGCAPRVFRQIWDELNAARGYGWDKNPWVWVIEFRRMP